jgi:ABC-type bacteriocin/lantibiotic exporter with double-glycine peptidase domain
VAAPEAIELIIQKADADCGVACLAMILGRPYLEVAEYTNKSIKGYTVGGGLELRQIRAIARHFGEEFQSIPINRHSDLSEETGILSILKKTPHVVVIFQGTIIDPASGLIYTPEAYAAYQKGRFNRLLRA